jgi:hypothetical protein
MSPASLPVVDAFRIDLTAAPDVARRHPAGSRVAALAVAALVLSAVAVLSWHDAQPAIAVERAGGETLVRLNDATAGPWELTQQLQAAGVKAHVLVAPATPDAVGTWVAVKAQRIVPAGVDPSTHDDFDEGAEQRSAAERLRGVSVDGDVVRIPAGYPYDLVLIAGARPKPGQEPVYDRHGPLLLRGTAISLP